MTGISALHFEAVRERIAAAELDVLDGEQEEIPDSLQQYAVIYTNPGLRTPERLNNLQLQVTTTFWIHSVGITREQARDVADRVLAQTLDFRPVIPGRSCWRIKHEASQPIRLDEKSRRYYGVDELDLTSTPARIITP